MRKITRQDFQGLQQHYPVLTEEEMRYYVGGYSDGYSGGGFDDWLNHGFGGYDPDGNYHWYSGYTQDELNNWEGNWPGGWVYGWGYVAPDTVIYGSYGDTGRPTYNQFETEFSTPHLYEGMGWYGGTFTSYLNVRELNGVLEVSSLVKGIPGASATYNYGSFAEVYVNGKMVEEVYFKPPTGEYVIAQGDKYVGDATVDISKYHGTVEVKVFTNGGNGDSFTGHSANKGGYVTIYKQSR